MPRRQPAEPKPSGSRNYLGPLTMTGGGAGAATLIWTGAPPWVTIPLIVACFACTVISTIFPQDSAHRLAWWNARWRHKREFQTRTLPQQEGAAHEPQTRQRKEIDRPDA